MEEFCDVIERVFGHRPHDWQGHAIQNLRAGRDVMIQAPTGAGKSLVYEAMVKSQPGAKVLVISPLIALMEDQVYLPSHRTC
jgi:superfamily II DNA helicase RecQ